MPKSFWFVPLLVLALLLLPASQSLGQGGSFPEGEGQLNGIVQKQTEALQKLAAEEQKIQEMEKEEHSMDADIKALNLHIDDLQRSMAAKESAYAQNKASLAEVLQTYQRMGPGSYLEIMLQSHDLTDFLQRINILRELTGHTGKLIEELQTSRNQQAADKAKLTEQLALVADKQEQFNKTLAAEQQFKQDLETGLKALADEKANYQKFLVDIQTKWDELKPVVSKSVKEFSGLLTSGNVPRNAFKLSGDFLNIKVSVDAKSLNEIIAGDSVLPKMVFALQPGNVEMRMPDNNLVLDGTFVIQGDNRVLLQVQEGSFYGLPLETGAIHELFRDGGITLNLKPMLGDYTIKSLEMMDGYLQFSMSPEILGGANDD